MTEKEFNELVAKEADAELKAFVQAPFDIQIDIVLRRVRAILSIRNLSTVDRVELLQFLHTLLDVKKFSKQVEKTPFLVDEEFTRRWQTTMLRIIKEEIPYADLRKIQHRWDRELPKPPGLEKSSRSVR